MEPSLNDIDSHSHSTVINAINMQMKMPLETTSYQSSATQDNAMKDANSGLQNLNKTGMNFETTRKDIFESSGGVQIQREVSPRGLTNDLTSTMMQTQITSVGFSTKEASEDVQTKPMNAK